MRVLFLLMTFLSLVVTVHAQRTFNEYTCQVFHDYHERVFYLSPPQVREINIGEKKVYAGMKRIKNEIEISLRSVVNVLDATYEKEAKLRHPLHARMLPVELQHNFAGRTDTFQMTCYPRDP